MDILSSMCPDAAQALTQFHMHFIPIGCAHEHLHLTQQYARRLILEHGIQDQDYVYVHNRIYVVAGFLDQLRSRQR